MDYLTAEERRRARQAQAQANLDRLRDTVTTFCRREWPAVGAESSHVIVPLDELARLLKAAKEGQDHVYPNP